MKYLTIPIILIVLLTALTGCHCRIDKVASQNILIIKESGLPQHIEIGLSLNELGQRGINYRYEGKNSYSCNEHYSSQKLNAEFEIENYRIIRIWFFSKKYGVSNLKLEMKEGPLQLFKISAQTIISSYGEVEIFKEKHPEEIDKVAYWDKYDPFNLKISTISYPNKPYLFMLYEKEMLRSITVFSRSN